MGKNIIDFKNAMQRVAGKKIKGKGGGIKSDSIIYIPDEIISAYYGFLYTY